MGINVKSVLRAAATVAAPLVTSNPYGAAVLAAVNAFLPDRDKLSDSATGADAVAAVKRLPAEQQAALFAQHLQLAIHESDNWAANIQAMADADKAGASTRPRIAWLMAWYVVAIGVVLALALCLAIDKGEATVTALGQVWPLALALTALPATLLRAYFGLRTKEKHARYAAATGQPVPEAGGVSAALGKIFGG